MGPEPVSALDNWTRREILDALADTYQRCGADLGWAAEAPSDDEFVDVMCDLVGTDPDLPPAALAGRPVSFTVQARQCATCIYRRDTHFDIKALEAAIADQQMAGFFKGHRVCHHSKDVCCRGFWNRHKDAFTVGQLAQRLGFVEFVRVDTLKDKGRQR